MHIQQCLSVTFTLLIALPVCVESGVDANHAFFRRHFKASISAPEPNQNSTDVVNDTRDGLNQPSGDAGQCSVKSGFGQSLVILPGPQGSPGPPGPRGFPGNPGLPGYPGMNGHNGERGVCKCLKGPKGDEGQLGDPGPNGNDGPPGPQGPPGEAGPPGPIGQKGVPGECTGNVDGLKGDAGLPGVDGVKGETGDPGDPGQDAVCDSRLCTAGGRAREQPGRGVRRRRQKYSAFSVSKYGTEEAIDASEIITWDHEFTNFGDDFSSDTGIFNCSISGYYFFTFNIYKSSTVNYPLVRLMLNGDVQVSVIDADYWDSEDSSSNSVILDLAPRDLVWLELYEGRVIHSSYYRYTTFSGTLLRAT